MISVRFIGVLVVMIVGTMFSGRDDMMELVSAATDLGMNGSSW